MKSFILALFPVLAGFGPLFGQDVHFTQFYAAPLVVNPALTGGFEGTYRINTLYRDQWRKVLDQPIRTFMVGADLRFDAPGKSVYDDAIGLGLHFMHDKVGVIDFSTTQIAVSMAYHKSLSVSNRQFLSAGIQAGLNQRNLNYANLNFPDEFNGTTGYTLPTGEDLPTNNFAFSDFNTGLNYSARIGRHGALFAGLAYSHFLQPRVSFFENTNKGDKLYSKLTGMVSAQIPFGKTNRVSITPRFMAAQQGPHLEINTGANLRFALGEYGGSAFHVGGWARPVRNTGGVGLDAAVALVGFEYNGVLLGLSYDLNTTALSANQRQGAFEISISYLGNYDSEEILCPKF